MEKEQKSEVELTEVPTQMAIAYKLPNGETVSADGLLLWIANTLYDIKKGLV